MGRIALHLFMLCCAAAVVALVVIASLQHPINY